MSETSSATQIERHIRDLKTFNIFRDLPEADLQWLAEHMDEVKHSAGEVYAHQGDPLDHLMVLLEGEVQFERQEAPGVTLFQVTAGNVTGLLPFSRLTNYKGTARAVTEIRALSLHRKHFPEMLQRMPLLGQRLVALMSDRIRENTRQETQQDKLMALGKLSAGLAHELNNPAAAARRAAQSLGEAMTNVREASLRFFKKPLPDETRVGIMDFEKTVLDRANSKHTTVEDPLEVSDREERITEWLEQYGAEEPWKVAGELAQAGVQVDELEELARVTGREIISPVLKRVASIVTIYGLIAEIDNTTKRIGDLVTAIKRYSYMDQSPIQEVDLREDLENTLKIFGHRIKKGVNVVREYDPNLPKVCAYGGELNQVWTNLIDNAIDAMNGNGELRVKAARELDHVVVEIGDNGTGVPAELQNKIFDPFFTTKGVGEGTGLGLDTAMRIVRKHHGSIELKSTPGDTRFRVRLPLDQPKALAQPLERQAD